MSTVIKLVREGGDFVLVEPGSVAEARWRAKGFSEKLPIPPNPPTPVAPEAAPESPPVEIRLAEGESFVNTRRRGRPKKTQEETETV